MASADGDDLDTNPYFKSLQSKFKKKFDLAQEKCCLICIPKTESIKNVILTNELIDNHILKLSPPFKHVYVSIASSKKVLEIENNLIQTVSGYQINKKIKIIGREYGYNKKSQQFEMIILDEPLIPVQRVFTKPNKNDILLEKIQLTVRDLTFAKCAEFLHGNPDHEEIVFHLDLLLQQFISNYFVLPRFLTLTANKVKEIIDDTVNDLCVIYRDVINNNYKISGHIRFIVESYIMGTIHNKIFPVVCQHLSMKDKELADKLLKLDAMNITADQLGIKEVFCTPQKAAVVELASLDSFITPLEKLNCLRNTMQVMTETIQHYLKENKQIISLQMVEMPALTTEDLISILVTVIIQSKLTHLASNLFYISNFHWPCSLVDKSSFDLVTFEAAVEHIKNTNFGSLKPPKTQLKKELSLEELIEVTGKVTALERQQGVCTTSVTSSSSSSTRYNGTDRELERITKMIEASTRELQTVVMLGVSKSPPQTPNSGRGEFFSNLHDNFGVCFGKQT